MNNQDGFAEKPTRYQQWHERSMRPIAAREITGAEIEEYRQCLVKSYKCEDNDITYTFELIKNENDEDRDDCMHLKYKLRCVMQGLPKVREIFSIKVPIPEDVKLRRYQQMYEKSARAQTASVSEVSETPASTAQPQSPGPSAPQTPLFGGRPQRQKILRPTICTKRKV